MRQRALVFEILRFLIVGSLAFVVDFAILALSVRYLFHVNHGWGLYAATAFGFLAGVVTNYALSVLFVFRSAKASRRSPKEFLVFAELGFVGFLLTEGGMYLGVGVLALNYQIAKVLVTGLVLVWNYLSRKLVVFQPNQPKTKERRSHANSINEASGGIR
ncbi:GtrA-like protein [Peptococcaceae bacterium CEB3]|nr:GtrA-like protein [Peptococcaceae bacterium CEB3]